MCHLHISLIHHSIVQRGVNLHMSQHLLHLFYRHTLVNSHCCQSPTEFVRMNLVKVYFLAELAQTNLHTANGQSGVWRMEANEQSRIGICALLQIPFEVDLSDVLI